MLKRIPTLLCHEQAGWLLSQICCTLESEGIQSCSGASDDRVGSCKVDAQRIHQASDLMCSMRDQPACNRGYMLACCCLRKDQQGLHIPPGALSYKHKCVFHENPVYVMNGAAFGKKNKARLHQKFCLAITASICRMGRTEGLASLQHICLRCLAMYKHCLGEGPEL